MRFIFVQRNLCAALMGAAFVSMVGSGTIVAARGGERLVAQGFGDVSDPSQLSDTEKLRYSRATVDEVQNSLDEVGKDLEMAQGSNDALYQCHLSAYTALNSIVEVVQYSVTLLEEAIREKKSSLADSQIRKIVMARTKARQLAEESSECESSGGGGGGASNEPTVTVEDSSMESTEDVQDPTGGGWNDIMDNSEAVYADPADSGSDNSGLSR